jgi:hypothetical protein
MSQKQTDSIFVGSDNDVNVRGVAAAREPSTYLADATVTFALYTTDIAATALAGTPISGTAGTCSYVTGSNGDYLGAIADDQTGLLTLGTVYWLGVKIVTQDGMTDRRAIPYVAASRGKR